jgi:hypothetical protein
MMGRLVFLLGGILLGGVLMYVAFSYHLVVTAETFYLVSKQQTELADAYVDIRDWGVNEWNEHPRLADAMIAAGHGDLVQRSLRDQFFEHVLDRIGVNPVQRQ